MKGLKHGIYEIYWNSGGSSLAAVGYDSNGNNWIAPCNWCGGDSECKMGTTDWSIVKAYKILIENDYAKTTKGIKSVHSKVIL